MLSVRLKKKIKKGSCRFKVKVRRIHIGLYVDLEKHFRALVGYITMSVQIEIRKKTIKIFLILKRSPHFYFRCNFCVNKFK